MSRKKALSAKSSPSFRGVQIQRLPNQLFQIISVVIGKPVLETLEKSIWKTFTLLDYQKTLTMNGENVTNTTFLQCKAFPIVTLVEEMKRIVADKVNFKSRAIHQM